MTIEYCTREKAQSLASSIPGLLGQIALAPEESSFLLIATEKAFKTFFAVAILFEGEVFYLSDEDLRPAVDAFLTAQEK